MPFDEDLPFSFQRGVLFISKDLHDAKGNPQTVTLLRPNNGQAVKVPCMFGSSRMDSDHGRLVFLQDGTVLLYDMGSQFGTFVYSQDRETALEKDKPYELRERESVIFGSRKYEGQGTLAARVFVKFLSYSPQIRVVAAPDKKDSAVAPMNFDGEPKPSNQTKALNHPTVKDASKLTALQYRHRANKSDSCLTDGNSKTKAPSSTQYLGSTSKSLPISPRARRSFDNKGANHHSPQQYLDATVIIPSTHLTLGDGIDALTGETMTSGLDPKSVLCDAAGEAAGIEDGKIEVLKFYNLNSIQSERVAGIGATINVLPVNLGADVKSTFYTETSKFQRVIFLRHTVTGSFPMQRLKNPILKPHLKQVAPDDFRAKYGDYFVNGAQRCFGYDLVIACSVNEGSEVKAAEAEAQISAGSIFNAIAKALKATRKTYSFTLSTASLRLFGYSAGHINIDWGSTDDVSKALAERGAPIGVTQLFELRHYSLLEDCNLPRTLDISHFVFEEIDKMGGIYLQLQNQLSHPAITPHVRSCIVSAMECFKSNRRFFALNDSSSQTKRHSVLKELKAATQAADTRIKRYNLLQSTKYMDDKPKQVGDSSSRYKWECGHLGKATRPEKQYGKAVEICGVEAFEVDWETPEIKHTILDRSHTIKFWSENIHSKLSTPDMPSPAYISPAGEHRPSRISSGDVFGLHRRLMGAKFTVLGWSISCEGKGKPEPRITPSPPNSCLLQDMFEVNISTTVTTRWHCRVTFLLYEPEDEGII